MILTEKVQNILSNYSGDTPGTKSNLAKILMHGKLGGTGRMLILPVDQGFEHGPARSFASNPDAYDPLYHYSLAVEAGLSAYAAPLGMLEVGAEKFAGAIPTILKMNSANSLNGKNAKPDQAITASIEDALRLGCSAIGFTIYPGSENIIGMMEEIKDLALKAKSLGLAVVIWSYPRGGDLSKKGETALDVCAYAAHMACLLGAHIVKVKLPTDFIEQPEADAVYSKFDIKKNSLADRVAHVKQACFAGKRLVVFSGGTSKNLEELYEEIRAIHNAGGNGSIIGRNTFQRPRKEALNMLNDIVSIYKEDIKSYA
ncbi:MAG: class I fructose-bisphosphate aldolase [Alphaproteobacteria bacterium]|nr:class I fructose-bisphosphate aldolase [Alphaproteobacteria bacterium]